MICHSIQTPNLKMSLALIVVYHLIFPDVKARLSVVSMSGVWTTGPGEHMSPLSRHHH